MENTIIILLLSLLFSAFFSGGEMAFISSNKLLIELNRKKHSFVSRIIDRFMEHSGTLIATILVGNNIAMVIYSMAFSDLMEPFITDYISDRSSVIMFLQTVVSTIIIIIVAEFLPKALVQLNPSTMLNVLALPLYVFYLLLYPIGRFMQQLSHFILSRLLGVRAQAESVNLLPGRVDLANLLETQSEQPQGDADESVTQEAKLMKNTLDFSKIRIRDCAIPRTDIVGLDITSSVDDLKQLFISSGYSKIIVYQNDIDNIIGYVHVSDIFKNHKSIRNMMYPIVVVPETMAAKKLLKLFTEQHKSIALVVDEFGGTAGIITLEDVLEEIFGEINDEHDVPEYVEKKVSDSEYVFSGRLEIDYLNEKYNLKLPVQDDYETMAGLILWVSKSIPKEGEVIELDNFRFSILEASNSRIEQVRLTLC